MDAQPAKQMPSAHVWPHHITYFRTTARGYWLSDETIVSLFPWFADRLWFKIRQCCPTLKKNNYVYSRGSNHRPWHRDAWALLARPKSQLVGQRSNHSSQPYAHLARFSFSIMSDAFFTANVLAPNLEYPTGALHAKRNDIGRHCNKCWNCPARGSKHRSWHFDDWALPVRPKSQLVGQSGNHSSLAITHPPTLILWVLNPKSCWIWL